MVGSWGEGAWEVGFAHPRNQCEARTQTHPFRTQRQKRALAKLTGRTGGSGHVPQRLRVSRSESHGCPRNR